MRNRLTVMLMLLALGVLAAGLAAVASEPDESAEPIPDDAATATFAGGCFWCTEAAFEQLDGVYEAVSGYTGGTEVDPTYEQVARGLTGHAEAVEISYDPEQVSYDELLDLYWRIIDPTDEEGQFVDRGQQYRTEIFYHDDEQRALAEASRDALAQSGRFDRPIVTEISRGRPVLPRRGIPPGLLPEDARPIRPLQEGLGPRPVRRTRLGR